MAHFYKGLTSKKKLVLSGAGAQTLESVNLLTLNRLSGDLGIGGTYVGGWHVCLEIWYGSSGTPEGSYGYARREFFVRWTGSAYVASGTGTQFQLGSDVPTLTFTQSSGETWLARAQTGSSGNYVGRYELTVRGFTDNSLA